MTVEEVAHTRQQFEQILRMIVTESKEEKQMQALSTEVKNILSVYYKASQVDIASGMRWYEIASEIAYNLAIANYITADQAVGVIAALSPKMAWTTNIVKAEQVISGFKMGLEAHDCSKGIMSANMGKAWRILNGEPYVDVLGGFKVNSFFECIRFHKITREVCVDTHAISVAAGTRCNDKQTAKVFKSEKNYRHIADAYRQAADIVGIKPHQMQAITWVTWRRIELGVVD